jgi:fatty acid desaturase
MVMEETNKVKVETRYLSLMLTAVAFTVLLFGIADFVYLSKAAAVELALGQVDNANTLALVAWGALIMSVVFILLIALFMKYINKRMRMRSKWFSEQIAKQTLANKKIAKATE